MAKVLVGRGLFRDTCCSSLIENFHKAGKNVALCRRCRSPEYSTPTPRTEMTFFMQRHGDMEQTVCNECL